MSGQRPDGPASDHGEAILPLANGRLFVRAAGDGDPIVVLHGGPSFDHAYFLPELDRLGDLGRLVYYDQRGRGRSYGGETADDITLDGELADLDAVRGWSGADRVAVLGHSWGTLLALEYAVRHPDRVTHLVLLNPAPASHAGINLLRAHVDAIQPPEAMARMAALQADPAFLAGDIAVEADYFRLWFAPALVRQDDLEKVVGRIRRWFRPDGIAAARAIQARLYELSWNREDYDLLPALAGLGIPTLVLTGDHDFIPVAIAQEIADAIPGARLEVVPDCGHFSYLEQPDAVHRAVASLLRPPPPAR